MQALRNQVGLTLGGHARLLVPARELWKPKRPAVIIPFPLGNKRATLAPAAPRATRFSPLFPSLVPAAPPSFVNSGTFASSASATTLSPSLPGSRVNGNLLIAFFTQLNQTATVTVSGSGWTLGDNLNSTSSGAWAWRIVDGSEAAVTFNSTANAQCTAQCFQISGTSVNPIGSKNSNDGTSDTVVVASITTTAAKSMILAGLMVNTNTTISLPTGYTSGSVTANARGSNHWCYEIIVNSGGSSTAISQTVTGASRWLSFGIEIKAA